MSEMNEIDCYVLRVADFFNKCMGAGLADVYKLGSLAHAALAPSTATAPDLNRQFEAAFKYVPSNHKRNVE